MREMLAVDLLICWTDAPAALPLSQITLTIRTAQLS